MAWKDQPRDRELGLEMVGGGVPTVWLDPKVPPQSTRAGPSSKRPWPPIGGWPMGPPIVAVALALLVLPVSDVSYPAGRMLAGEPGVPQSPPSRTGLGDAAR